MGNDEATLNTQEQQQQEQQQVLQLVRRYK